MKFGGTNIYAFNALTGDHIWQEEFLPTSSISFNPNLDVNNNLVDNIVPLSYTIDDSFLPQLAYHQGLSSIDLETGKPNFMNTYENNQAQTGTISTISAVSLGDGFYSVLSFNDSGTNQYTLYTLRRINSTGSFNLPYKAQNDALWQVNTNKVFSNIVTGQLDTDAQQEMIIYNNRLIAAVDNNGQFLWKFVTAVDINQILMANLDNSGLDEVVVLLKDSTLLTLDPNFGLELSSQTLPFFVPVKMVAVDFSGDNVLDLVLGEKNPAGTFGGLLGLKYLSSTFNFSLSMTSGLFTGSFKDFLLMDVDGDGKATDYLLFFDTEIVLLKSDFSYINKVPPIAGVTYLAVTVADYNMDGKSDFAFLVTDSVNTILVAYNGSASFHVLSGGSVKTGLLVAPNQQLLYSIDLTRDGKPDIVQYQFGRGFALYNPLAIGNPIGYWHERSWISGFLTDVDIDFDGYNDLILRNERLVYAIKYNSTSTANLDHFYTSWSSPLSSMPILKAVPAKLSSTNSQLVYINTVGQLFAVEGISSPSTLVNYEYKFDYQSTKPGLVNIDTLHWSTTSWSDDLFDSVEVNLPILSSELRDPIVTSLEQSEQSLIVINPVFLFITSFLTGLITVALITKRYKVKSKNRIKEQDSVILGGAEK